MGTKRNIAVVMELEWPYRRHYEVFAGICDYAAEHGDWNLDIGNFPEYEIELGKKYHGIIGRISESCMAAARKKKIPVVNLRVDSPVATLIPSVHPDFKAAGSMAAEHLINRGLRRIVHFGFKHSSSSDLHYQGMLEVAKEHGVSCKRYVVAANFHEDLRQWKHFAEYTTKALNSWKPPVGIAFSTDELGHAVVALCNNHGWKIPEQMAAIGTNNEVMICNSSSPPLSSIDMAHKVRGYEAAAMLDVLMKGGKLPPPTIRLVPPKELVLRRSSDAYAVDDGPTQRALAFMSQNFHRKISVIDIAKAAGIGRQSLEHRFRKHLNQTINNELIRIRISVMKRLLVDGKLSIGEISDHVGFGTTSNMHVMFKRYTQMTPIAYREKHHGSIPFSQSAPIPKTGQ